MYRDYFAYYQADGEEQLVFDERTSQLRARSDVLLERLTEAVSLGECGEALDIGCGTGVTLRALGRYLPGYRLYGQDLDRRNEGRLRNVPNFVELYTCATADIPRRFDLVTLIHSLEHFPAPLDVLKSVRDRLERRGLLLIEVCDVDRNPFDLLVVDHLMHFSARTLAQIVGRTGFQIRTITTEWINKELSCVAQAGDDQAAESGQCDVEAVAKMVNRHLDWLRRMIETAEGAVARYGRIGIFGTSISGTWLAGCIPQGFDFFVDEDPNRVGRLHMGKPVLAPRDVEPGSALLLALVPSTAKAIGARLTHLPVQFVYPPAIALP